MYLDTALIKIKLETILFYSSIFKFLGVKSPLRFQAPRVELRVSFHFCVDWFLESQGSGQGPLLGSCKHGKESSGSIIGESFSNC